MVPDSSRNTEFLLHILKLIRISNFIDFWLSIFYKFKSLNKPEDKNVIPERYVA